MLKHIAIIMDGNSRWAEARNFPRIEGHRRGAESLRNVIKGCIDCGIAYLTVYAFSSENWNRPKQEVNDIMHLLKFYLGREVKELHKNKVRINFIGDRSKLDKDILKQMEDAEGLTKGNTKLSLNIAISYGSRQEIVDAAASMAKDFASGKVRDFSEETFESYLNTSHSPDPDLLIRTGGEERLSNFLLWQSAYTELHFTPVLWPDFGTDELKESISEFEKRDRRYGKREIAAAG